MDENKCPHIGVLCVMIKIICIHIKNNVLHYLVTVKSKKNAFDSNDLMNKIVDFKFICT